MPTLTTPSAPFHQQESRSHLPKPGRMFCGNLKLLAVIISFLGLGALNILTLVNDTVHAAAYGVVRAVTANKVVDAIGRGIFSKPMLINSPTNKRLSDLKIATQILVAEKTALVSANRVLETKHAILEKSYKVLETKHISSIAATKKFSHKVALRTIKNATRNVTGMAGEAIPFIGVGVMAAVTALDIDDACNNLRDLNEMNSAIGLDNGDQNMVCGMRIPTTDELLAQVKNNWYTGYKAAADSVNQVRQILPSKPPNVSWPQDSELMRAVSDWFH